ncbi:MAG: hypothetical protein P8I79_09320 [Amylibacter sp.]|nr:hypothetical protein [Amylibacter sp.]
MEEQAHWIDEDGPKDIGTAIKGLNEACAIVYEPGRTVSQTCETFVCATA